MAGRTNHSGEKFAKAFSFINGRRDLTANAKMVYACIADRMNKDGVAWPGYRKLADDAGCHVATVERAVAQLNRKGLLVVEHRAGRYGTNRYMLGDSGARKMRVPAKCGSPQNAVSSTSKMRSQAPAKCVHNQTQQPDSGTRLNKPPKWSAAQIASVYDAYPRKIKKKRALEAIPKALIQITKSRDPPEGSVAWLKGRVTLYAQARAGQNPKYTPYPATWFNDARYDDDPSEWRQDQHCGTAPDPCRIRSDASKYAGTAVPIGGDHGPKS